jgi:hypothetical protein
VNQAGQEKLVQKNYALIIASITEHAKMASVYVNKDFKAATVKKNLVLMIVTDTVDALMECVFVIKVGNS